MPFGYEISLESMLKKTYNYREGNDCFVYDSMFLSKNHLQIIFHTQKIATYPGGIYENFISYAPCTDTFQSQT